MKHTITIVLVVAVIAFAGGYLVRGHGAQAAKQAVDDAALHVDAATQASQGLIDTLYGAQRYATDVTHSFATVTQSITSDAQAAKEIVAMTDSLETSSETTGDALDQLETEVKGLMKYRQPIYPDDLQPVLDLIRAAQEAHQAQEAIIAKLKDHATGLEASLAATIAQLDHANTSVATWTMKASEASHDASVVRTQLAEASKELQVAKDTIAAGAPVPWIVGAGAAGVGLLIGGLFL